MPPSAAAVTLSVNPSTPTVSMQRAMGCNCKVADDEHKASQLCSACKSRFDGPPLPLLENSSSCSDTHAIPLACSRTYPVSHCATQCSVQCQCQCIAALCMAVQRNVTCIRYVYILLGYSKYMGPGSAVQCSAVPHGSCYPASRCSYVCAVLPFRDHVSLA